jgi:transcriptional regulator with XRE-family HTH domain
MGMAAAKLAIEAARLLSAAFTARKDVDQKALAELIGVSDGRVSQVLHGDGNVHIGTLARYMAAMGYELELTAKPIEAGVPEVKAPGRRRLAGRAPEKRLVSFKYHIQTFRDAGVGRETIELPGVPGEAPPFCLSAPVLVVKTAEPKHLPSHSAASDEVQERTRVLSRQR